MNLKLKCKICGQEFTKYCNVTSHTKRKHNIDSKTYYDTYFKLENEGFCKNCGKQIEYRDLQHGYREFCNRTCFWQYTANQDSIKNKRKQTCLKKYGSTQYMSCSDFQQKSKQTNLEKYGYSNPFADPKIIAKIRQTKIKNCTLHNEQQIMQKQDAIKSQYAKYLKDQCQVLSYDDSMFSCKCNKCNSIFELPYQTIYNRLHGNRTVCTVCNPVAAGTSDCELKLVEYVKSLCDNVQTRVRSVISSELDIYLPEKKLAFEFDGLYWHSELYKNKNYHLTKTNECESKGIQLIHIFEDEWLYKQEIVKSRISGLLCKNTRIFARKCKVKEVCFKEAKTFLEKNHIQGSCNSKYNLGLYHDEELVSLMTFGKSRFKKDEFELLRFCNKLYTNVVGGASKLFKHFLKNHSEIKNIISYADRRWSIGKLYEKLGFNKDKETQPSYYYVKNQIRENRIKYQKHKLITKTEDNQKTEHELMKDKGYIRIYDCGTIKFRFTI